MALIRADRVSEAWPLINEVESVRDDFDENTLQALCHCFKVLAELVSVTIIISNFYHFLIENMVKYFIISISAAFA